MCAIWVYIYLQANGNVSRYLSFKLAYTTYADANESYSVRISIGVSFYRVNLLRIRYCS